VIAVHCPFGDVTGYQADQQQAEKAQARHRHESHLVFHHHRLSPLAAA
jgi:hypothetical protein